MNLLCTPSKWHQQTSKPCIYSLIFFLVLSPYLAYDLWKYNSDSKLPKQGSKSCCVPAPPQTVHPTLSAPRWCSLATHTENNNAAAGGGVGRGEGGTHMLLESGRGTNHGAYDWLDNFVRVGPHYRRLLSNPWMMPEMHIEKTEQRSKIVFCVAVPGSVLERPLAIFFRNGVWILKSRCFAETPQI